MSKTSDKRTTTLKVEKFSHTSHKPRSERWREWYSKLKFAFGAALPMIANQIGQQCDPTSHWWGLEWNSAFFDFDSMSAEEEKKMLARVSNGPIRAHGCFVLQFCNT